MKAASIQDIKQELATLNKTEIAALCLRLAKYKKENKELLNFILFEAHDIDGYIKNVQQEIDELFTTINTSHVYFAKKTLRKILRFTNKYIKYAQSKQAEVELLLYYCTKFKAINLHKKQSQALSNIFEAQVKKIETAITSLHEDLQFEYRKQVEAL
jgi:uncharacterized membrane protein YgaE (UPF0421/DUF939 family)